MRVLAIGAHYDDIELGCGGSLLMHKNKGDEIFMLVITNSNYKSPISDHIRIDSDAKEEGRISSNIIGAKLFEGDFKTLELTMNKELINYLCTVVNQIKPDIVYTHYGFDQHHDHQVVGQASLIACRDVPLVLAYASNFYDPLISFNPNYFNDISDFYERKLELIKNFKSELDTHIFWFKQLEYYNGMFGLKNKTKYVEPFVLIRFLRRS